MEYVHSLIATLTATCKACILLGGERINLSNVFRSFVHRDILSSTSIFDLMIFLLHR